MQRRDTPELNQEKPTSSAGSLRERLRKMLGDSVGIIGMLAALLVLGAIEPAILRPANLGSILDQSASLVILAVGFSVAMMVRGVDLSVAQVADAAGVIAAMLLVRGQPLWMVFVLPIAFGILIGVFNGTLMAYLGVPALIGTLGMMFIVRSFALVLSSGREAQILFTLPPAKTAPFFFFGQDSIGPIPVSVLFAVLVVAILYAITNSTSLGRYMAAIGGNVRAAYLSGVQHRRVFALGFLISAVTAALAGMLVTSRAALAAPGALEPMLLDGFVAVYLGSLVVRSGQITVIGSAVGAIFVGVIGNALTLMGAGVAARYIAYGVIILVAMTVGALRQRT